jgi:hypothetical protein
MTAKPPASRTVRITRKSPVAWLNLQLLIDTGILAAVSSFTGSRSPRREVLAALEPPLPDIKPYFDYSMDPQEETWIDFIADLGDGFNATTSIAWLVGRDYLGLGAVGDPVEQPYPPTQFQECGPEAFGTADHVLKAGQITIFGGDLVYPYATRTEYEDRTVGPYLVARPWQLEPGTKAGAALGATGRRLFSIPGNHDWYDGLSAFVQRFCQPHRWMGCWEVQQRRSYFAIKLPHKVWIWGVDLATDDDFDAPQLEYFDARAADLEPGDDVILCVPKPAWIDRKVKATPDPETPSRSWESWKKVERIRLLIDGERSISGAHVRAILSGDQHHYSRYETPDEGDEKTHLVTCGGGGAFLHGTDALPSQVNLDAGIVADFKACFPSAQDSGRTRFGVLTLQANHWKLFGLLGLTLMSLVWLWEVQRPETFLTGPALFSTAFFCAIGAAIVASPISLLFTGLVFVGFCAFARTGQEGLWWRPLLGGAVHCFVQLTATVLLLHFAFMPILLMHWPAIPTGILLVAMFVLLGWTVPGWLFTLYLLLANLTLGLHHEEVFSAQGIEDRKAFLRIRVNGDGIVIYPIGLNKISHDWLNPDRERPFASTATDKSRMHRIVRKALNRVVTPEDEIAIPTGATHVLLPSTKLAPHLIEKPIIITRKGSPS